MVTKSFVFYLTDEKLESVLWFVTEIINGLCSLGPLVGKVKECQVEMMVDTLCSNMVSNKEQLRDISSMGLKTVIAELPPASTGNHGNTWNSP